VSDLYGVRLSSKDASSVGTEHQLTRSSDNAHSPALAPYGDGAVLGWIEEKPLAGDHSAAVMLARLDSGAEIATAPLRVQFERKPRSLVVKCEARTCRVVTTNVTRAVGELNAFVWEPGTAAKPRIVASMVTPLEDPPAPVLFDDDAVYADATDRGATHLRRINIEWKRK
jgi:hypothetical protein